MSFRLFDPTETLHYMNTKDHDIFVLRCLDGLTFAEISNRRTFYVSPRCASQMFYKALVSFLHWHGKIESGEAQEVARTFKLRNGQAK